MANITKMTQNDRGGKENKEISINETCSYMVSDLAYSAGACVEQLHLFNFTELIFTLSVFMCQITKLSIFAMAMFVKLANCFHFEFVFLKYLESSNRKNSRTSQIKRIKELL